ncbi:hypothetical protein PQX77_002402 [Marasmius sp. AFHP31]|nr:hypothetical protein PQX77_002402 [Marasmius sp. AFHP31]
MNPPKTEGSISNDIYTLSPPGPTNSESPPATSSWSDESSPSAEHFPSSLDTTNPTTTTQGTNSIITTPPRLSGTPTAATQGVSNKSSATIGGAVGGAIALILTVVVILVARRRRNRGGHRQAGWFATGFGRRRRRQNLKVSALPITTPGPERVAEKTRERRHQVDSPEPTVTDDSQRVAGPDSEVLAKLNMLIERVGGSSPGPAVDHGQGRGTDPEVLAAKLDMIMERVARLEEDRDREEAPPDYVSNRS